LTVLDNASKHLEALPQAGHLIGDKFTGQGSGEIFEHVNPSTGVVQATFEMAGKSDVDDAVTAAQAAFPTWRRVDANARRRMLLRVAELFADNAAELGAVATLENGVPAVWTPTLAAALPADYFQYYAGWVDKNNGEVASVYPGNQLNYSIPEPYGVIGILIPWNGPLTSISMKVAPALAAGNCVVIKPPELAPFSSIKFGEICLEAGIPAGVVNVVTGGPETGEAIVRHPGVNKISFTGSGATAVKIMTAAATGLKPTVMELGGKSPSIVFADADIDHASLLSAQLAMTTLSGQACVVPTRLIVEDAIYDEMVDRVSAISSSFKVGDPFEPDTLLGPIISSNSCSRIQGVIDTAIENESGRLVTGGKKLDGDLSGGYFIEPTVFADVENKSSLAQNEIFGPVLSVMRASGEEEAIRLANDTSYGLGGYVFTRDLNRAHRVAGAINAGSIGVNGFPLVPPNAVFGGKKGSGFGREGGRAGLEEFVSTKNVYVELEHPSFG